jgi:hypothetical protein
MPTPQNNASLPVWRRRHPEWTEHYRSWEQRYDSWEGGDRYRNATYGQDSETGLDLYNLVRHKHERPDAANPEGADYAGSDATARAGEGDFQYRRARTPPPSLVENAVESHLSKIYAHEVERDGPAELVAWWKDVDGQGSTIDDWMQDTIAPLLLVMGQLDLVFDHPPTPIGAKVESIHDQEHFGLTGCVASFVLPQNMLWWSLNRDGSYAECLVYEPLDEGGARYRYWTARASFLFDSDGNSIGTAVSHDFGRVPIVRVFDRRNPRCRNIGRSRYEAIVHIQREYYNRDSELILSDTNQAHPILQGPEEYCLPGTSIPLGTSFLLPMKKNEANGDATYQGFEVVPFPKDGAESIRLNKADLLDAADRVALLTKPAGAAGTDGSTVAQSGVSKRLDQAAGNDLLTKIAARLQACEMVVARTACMVLGVDPATVKLVYARTFDLATADELAASIEKLQLILEAAGNAPETETEMIRRLVRTAVPGLVDAQYKAIDEELKNFVADKAEHKKKLAEAAINAPAPQPFGAPANPNAAPPQPVASGTAPAPPVA